MEGGGRSTPYYNQLAIQSSRARGNGAEVPLITVRAFPKHRQQANLKVRCNLKVGSVVNKRKSPVSGGLRSWNLGS